MLPVSRDCDPSFQAFLSATGRLWGRRDGIRAGGCVGSLLTVNLGTLGTEGTVKRDSPEGGPGLPSDDFLPSLGPRHNVHLNGPVPIEAELEANSLAST